ncbi:uncharacterized protein LOC130994125 [Salvia miltiorrhiza]|uniref:uncharacterized protein LOC130994125 n=1 Tax=Salvia miltiorrhiza TaxID=226208 RepID=UPI0025AD6DA6|nr:uncharacterized protein LOC130994125 [Salvia miltiorrhiza]
MTGKGKKVQRSDVETPLSPPSKNKRRKTSATADAGGPSSSPSTSKVKKTYAKVVTCKRRGEKQLQETEPPPKFPSLNTRTTPASFHDSLRKLNDAQKQAVIDIGFGSILNLKVKKLPARLAFWILENFDERSCELELAGGIKVQITEDDVYRVYGFPKGSEIIPNFERTSNNAMCLEWSLFFGFASREKIKIGAVLSEMLNCSTGGSWFKRHFMIAMAHSLIESCTSGTVHPYILRCLENVTTLRNWNWGEYVLRSLIDHKKSWIGDEDKVFAGPSLFIVLFYVDRCQIHRTDCNTPIFPNRISR